MSWLALDIGGANLKAADGQGFAASQSFPLWQQPRRLPEAIRTLIAGSPPADHLAATMTGELADCFANKSDGVLFIVQALVAAADGRHTRIYLNNGMLVAPQIALRQPLAAAASNWHALARFAGRYAPQGAGLLIDIGSTTADFVGLVDGKPAALGHTDTERLALGELVYTGVQRSPVCALVDSLPWNGKPCPVAQEVFATMWDVYLILGELEEDEASTHTADRRPATKAAAQQRLARMICADRDIFPLEQAQAAAEAVAASQLDKLATAARQVLGRLPQPPATIVVSGQGEFLARKLVERLQLSGAVVSLRHELGAACSRCAPAHALAVIAREGTPT